MNKKTRQYLGLLCAVLAYYIIHEGAHLAYALLTGTFRQIHLIGLGIQVDVYGERMSQSQMGMFCLAGPIATVVAAWLLTGFTGKILTAKSKVFRACMYYVTAALLFVDPIYLCFLYRLVGGGDMNGISLLLPEPAVQIISGAVLMLHIGLFLQWFYPKYKKSFERGDRQ